MPRLAGLILLVTLAGGCTSLATEAAKSVLLGDKPALEVDSQIGGDRTAGGTVTRQAGHNNRIETNKVSTERVERITINERVPAWIWLLVAAALVLDSPLRWPEQLLVFWRRRRA